MSTFAFPAVTPNRSSMSFDGNTISHRSWLTNFTATQFLGGDRLAQTLFFSNLSNAQRALLVGFLAKLNGQQHRTLLQAYGHTSQGLFGGTPLVNGANQVGNQIIIDGASNNVTGWARAGDPIGFNQELKFVTDDADSDGSGNVTLNIRPSIRQSPADNAAVTVSGATGRFLLASPRTEWSNIPGDFSDLTLQFVEDF